MSKMVKQGKNQCGQACTAMILGISLEESIKLYGKDGVSSLLDAKEVISKTMHVHDFVKVDNRLKNPFEFTDVSLLRLRFRNLKVGHFVVYFNGRVLDPNGHVFNDVNECLRYYSERHTKCLVSHYMNVEEMKS